MSCKLMIAALLTVVLIVALTTSIGRAEDTKKVLLLGQKRDHPAGSHEYVPGLNVLAKSLQGVPGLELSIHDADEPWPEGPELIAGADAIVMFLGQGSRWEQLDPRRLKALQQLAARGGGIVGIHWAIGGKDAKYIPIHLQLMGGCHGGPDRKYIVTKTPIDVNVVLPRHPITTGVGDFRVKEEFYYRLKFAKQGTVRSLLTAQIEGNTETAAWAFERPDGGRSFGFGCMHYHSSWGLVPCRRLIAQGLLWTLKLPIPKDGLPVEITEEDLKLE